MAFKIPLGSSHRHEIQLEQSAADASYAMSDAELGRTLLELAMRLREKLPARFHWSTSGDGYDGALVWEVIPEVCRRLGVSDMARRSRPYALRNADDATLRNYAGHAILGCSPELLGGDSVARSAWRQLLREPANGNVLAIALDRTAVPTEGPGDPLARRIEEISSRRGFDAITTWRPELNAESVSNSFSP